MFKNDNIFICTPGPFIDLLTDVIVPTFTNLLWGDKPGGLCFIEDESGYLIPVAFSTFTELFDIFT